MNEAIRRRAKKGLQLLEESILEMLYHERLADEDGWVKNADIHNCLELPKPSRASSDPSPTDMTIVIMQSLHEEGRVECKPGRFWRLSESEFQKWHK